MNSVDAKAPKARKAPRFAESIARSDKQSKQAKEFSNKTKREVTLIYVPLYLGGKHRGSAMGPEAMRVADLESRIEKLGFSVAGTVDITVPNSVCWWDGNSKAKCVPEILEVSLAIADAVEQALDNNTIAITIGGDHSLAIGSIAGSARHFRKKKKEFGLFWFDAHADINTPDTSFSGDVHGMPLAVSLGLGDERLTQIDQQKPKIKPEHTALIGIRDLDIPEKGAILDTGIAAYTMKAIDSHGLSTVVHDALEYIEDSVEGIHVSFDLDAIDPEYAPGVTTRAIGGMSFRESHLALEMLAETNKICALDIVELNPAKDQENKTAELAVELVLSSLGKRIL